MELLEHYIKKLGYAPGDLCINVKKVGFGLVILAGLILFVPWCPIIHTFYYEYCMHLAVCEGWQFGTDIISTYGPLGFIGLPFYRATTYPSMILANIFLYGIMVAFLWEFWQSTVKLSRPSAIWIVIILILPILGPAAEWSPVLFIPYILVNLFVLRHFLGRTPPSHAYLSLFVLVLGLFVLVKGSFILLILMAVAVVAADQIIKSKKTPWIVPGFILSILIFWVFSNQKIGNIFDYFFNIADLIAGYKDGMADGKGTKLGLLHVIFALGSLGLAGTFFLTVKKQLGWRTIWPTSVLSATLFVMFQNGFVRQDAEHTVPACLSFCTLCALILPLLWNLSAGNKTLRLALVANGFLGIIIVFICGLSNCGMPTLNILLERIKWIPELITEGTSTFETSRYMHMQLLKQNYPLPEFDGNMESSTFDSGLAEAYGYHSMIRPTLTLYAANTSMMSSRNKDYLENPSGPKTILFLTMPAIDGRYATGTDAMGLLAQKTHFSAVGNVENVLILTRRPHPLELQFSKLRELNVGFNEAISLPDPGKGMILVQIEILPSLAGRLFSVLYKPAATFITVGVNNKEGRFRLIRATAQEGMILSPFLYDLPTFEAFYSDKDCFLKPSSFRIECERDREWCYRDRVKVVLLKADIK